MALNVIIVTSQISKNMLHGHSCHTQCRCGKLINMYATCDHPVGEDMAINTMVYTCMPLCHSIIKHIVNILLARTCRHDQARLIHSQQWPRSYKYKTVRFPRIKSMCEKMPQHADIIDVRSRAIQKATLLPRCRVRH